MTLVTREEFIRRWPRASYVMLDELLVDTTICFNNVCCTVCAGSVNGSSILNGDLVAVHAEADAVDAAEAALRLGS